MREVVRDPETGEVLAAMCVKRPLTEDERAAMVEVIRYTRQRMDAEPPEVRADMEMRQAASRERIRERNQRLGLTR